MPPPPDEGVTESFRELDSVRVVRPTPHELGEISTRDPRVGEVGTIVDVISHPSQETLYTVECVAADGWTVWIGEFAASQLQLVHRP